MTESRKQSLPKNETEWRNYLESRGARLVAVVQHASVAKTVVTTACAKCGIEESVPAWNLVRRVNICRSCGSRVDYTTERIRNVLEKYGAKLLEGQVTGKESQLRIRCACGQESEKRAHDVLRRPQSCQNCRGEKIRTTQLVASDNLQTAQVIAAERGGRCLTTERMVATHDRLHWECALGHTWHAQLSSVKHIGTWCPECRVSYGERLVRTLLEQAFDAYFPKQRPQFLAGLELDGFNVDLGLAFEHHGEQHYRRSPAFHTGERDLHRQVSNDVMKQIRCQNANVTLITVPYLVTDQGIEATRQFLHQAVAATGISPVRDIRQVELDMRRIYDPRQDHQFKVFAAVVRKRKGHFSEREYLGQTRPISVTCEHGFSWKTSPYLVRKGHWCPGPCCGNKSRRTIPAIRNNLAQKGWSLRKRNIKYRNAHQLLPMQCAAGHEIDRTWNDWQQGKHSCAQCRREAEARKFIVLMWMRGMIIELQPPEYQSEKQVVMGKCEHCSETMLMNINRWKHLEKCRRCATRLPPYFQAQVAPVNLKKTPATTTSVDGQKGKQNGLIVSSAPSSGAH